MGRYKGTFDFTSSFEMLRAGPLDARIVVQEKSDLQSSLTWADGTGTIWLYTGIVVSVIADITPANNGLYFLLDAENYTNVNSWVKLGAGSVAIWNGLETTDNSIGLGGDLYQNTTLNLNNHELLIDGSLGLFKYTKDNHENFTSRSIVDKGYVDNVVGNSIKGYSGTFMGDGVSTSFIINHNLSTLNQSITVYEDDGLMTYPDLERGLDTNVISFYGAPANGVVFSVVILGFTTATGKGYEETINGDGVTTSFNIDHNLGTIAQTITVFDLNTNSIIYPDLQRGPNTDVITFMVPPEVGENYSVVIIGF